ncbi:MAG: phosphatase PAP2 family protein [Gammaproteobacteria bacterium]|nr:phosphatase PAP2 family protein [Gammaproteobacteria bacterium]
MKHFSLISAFVITISFFSVSSQAEDGTWSDIKHDYSEFYSGDRLLRMGVVFAGGAILANTNYDQKFQDHYQNKVRSNQTDDLAVNFKKLGEGKYLIPLSLISAGVSSLLNDGTELTGIGKWGERTARAYLVGGPTVLATQLLTGASRPSESPYKSDWKPFNDSNGVSGHSFIGAVPFLTIAYMNNDNAFIKYSAYLASTFAGISRINDNQHYLSQVILGWYLGWEAVDSVYSVESAKKKLVRIQPVIGSDSYGLQVSMRW